MFAEGDVGAFVAFSVGRTLGGSVGNTGTSEGTPVVGADDGLAVGNAVLFFWLRFGVGPVGVVMGCRVGVCVGS